MKSLRVMSIIGITIFGLCIVAIIGLMDENKSDAVGFGMIGMLYAIAYSIVGLIQANKHLETNVSIKENSSSVNLLLELHRLKEKGIISDEEFDLQKMKILL